MNYIKDGDNFLISMAQDDDVIKSILTVVEKENLHSAAISGIGAVKDVTLGFYNLSRKEYDQKPFSGNFELVSCLGNVSEKEGEPFVHAHVSMSGPDFNTISGHLFRAKIAVVGEFVLRPFENKVVRKMDDDVGLAVWDLYRAG
ncbi:MAG TPA: DNA-binding protein [Candidatus Marinimicrobia bacterium]|jgi:predicted DNA-binding protein with PD1-like motif|nr:DNA-binding protein [Candidatus Neomarinimicrobiota bacterium]